MNTKEPPTLTRSEAIALIRRIKALADHQWQQQMSTAFSLMRKYGVSKKEITTKTK